MLEITPEIQIPLSEIEFSYVRSAGPGGQNVNKVASKAVLRWRMAESEALNPEQKAKLTRLYPTLVTKDSEVVVTSQITRDAPKNRDDCLRKLKQMVEKAIFVPKRRKATRPPKGSVFRRLENKAKKSEKIRQRRVTGE